MTYHTRHSTLPRQDFAEPDDVSKNDNEDEGKAAEGADDVNKHGDDEEEKEDVEDQGMMSEGSDDVMRSCSFRYSSLHTCFCCFSEYDKLPFRRRAIFWICGIDEHLQIQPQLSEEQLATAATAALVHIDEKPFWRRFTLAQAIILMFIVSFICGFFAYSEFIVPIDYPLYE